MWWAHDEADQLLAALDLRDGFSHHAQLAHSAQTFLDVYVDRDPAYPARETFTRVERTGTMTSLSKSFFGKNMLHNHEHALIMYLHGRAMEGEPARLYYAFPADQALTATAKPYWFDAAGESREVRGGVPGFPGHRFVAVDFTGIETVSPEPWPTPDDPTPPETTVHVAPVPNSAGWHRDEVTVALDATDGGVGVKELRGRVAERHEAVPPVAYIAPGADFTLPALTVEGIYDIEYFAVDLIGNTKPTRSLTVRIDTTAPSVAGMPPQPCQLWPPNKRMVRVAKVSTADALSGPADLSVTASADEPARGDIFIYRGRVYLRAERDGKGDGRTYTVEATATDVAGNVAMAQGTCVVPHHKPRWDLPGSVTYVLAHAPTRFGDLRPGACPYPVR